MKSIIRSIFLLLIVISSLTTLEAAELSRNKVTLWYDKPATAWHEATPIGNGRMGAMMFGQPTEEVFYLNEDTVWSGEPHDYTNVGAHQYLEQLRQLIRDEKYDEAKEFGAKHLLGVPKSQQGYQSLGKLHLKFAGQQPYTNYHRQLDMSAGLVDVQYQINDAVYTRQILASNPDQVIAMQLDCDKPGKITFEAKFSTEHEKHSVKQIGKDILVIEGFTSSRSGLGGKLHFQGQLHVQPKGGTIVVKDGVLSVTGADSATLRIVAATNYVNYKDISADPEKRCSDYLANALKSDFDQIKQRHIADHSKLFNRVSIDLGATDKDLNTPTNKLIEKIRAGKHSALIEQQVYQFARYMTIAGARPGTQPLNLVGIWAEGLNAPWGGKWTLNINAELNTWPVETGNLAECHQPLLMLLEDLRVTGTKVAKEHYNCRGFVAHHNTDLWRGSAPVDTAIHGLWTTGGAWLTRHIYEHYDFSRDTEYLKKYYPTIKQAALFFVDFLTEDQDGYLSTCPAISFEESFRKKDGTPGRLTYGPTMDNQILRDLFTNCIMASEVLDIDADFRKQIKEIMSKLRPIQIDPDTGRIREWAFAAEKAFRGNGNSGQTAPIWGVSPGRQITPKDTPKLAQAAIKYLNFHIPRTFGYETEGSWVTGTRINAWARLGQNKEAYKELEKIATRRLWPNLMMSFYGKNYFQIDGNMGTAAGMTEMLMQSHRLTDDNQPIIDLLPTLPKAWPTGSVKGLRGRGAFVVDIAWKDGKLEKVIIQSLKGVPLTIHYSGKTIQFKTEAAKTYKLDGKLSHIQAEQIILAKPSAKQLEFADWEVGAFFHYTLNPFTGQEHGDGKEPPSKFNPTELDVDQWLRTAKDMGAKYAVLTARHEGGFCLWPSKTTDYTIANSPYKKDLVKEFVDGCRRHGLKVGLYHTASHDAHTQLSWHEGKIGWGKERDELVEKAYKDMGRMEFHKKVQVEQMRELLTWYGPIDFMWSDHWNAQDPDSPWRAVTDLVAELQPNMVFMGPETWVPGNETGHVVYPMWNAVKTIDGTNYSRPATIQTDTSVQNDYGLLETDVYTGHPLGDFWRVRECTTSKGFDHGGWFWHRGLRDIPIEYRVDLYCRTVGLGANTIINLPPNTKGLIDDNTAKAAKAFGNEIKRRFSTPVAQTKGIQTGDVVELKWDKPCHIDHIITMENIANGQKISKYVLEAFVDGKWQALKPRNLQLAAHYKPETFNPDPGFETIGHKKIDRVSSVYTNHIRFRCLDSVVKPVEIRSLAVYNVYERILDLKADQPAYLGQVPFVDVHFDTRSYSFPGFKPRFREYLDGKKYEHSIIMPPYKEGTPSSVTFFLDVLPVQYKTFKATIGLPDKLARGKGSVGFQVELMHDGQWKQVYRSKVFKGGDAPENIEIDLNGAEAIRLRTTDAGDGRNSDHATWGNPRLTN